MAIIRANVILEAASLRSEDRAVNTFHFDLAGIGGSTTGLVMDLLEDFYTEEGDDPGLISYMSNELYAGGGRIDLYNYDDPEPRAPIDSRIFIYAAPSAECLPPEVSLCITFEGMPESGEAQARRRGRIYVPWLALTYTNNGQPTDGLCEGFAARAGLLLERSDDAADVDWIVWSPTNNSGTGIARGWVDNAWDTQRRRGIASTSRQFFGSFA